MTISDIFNKYLEIYYSIFATNNAWFMKWDIVKVTLYPCIVYVLAIIILPIVFERHAKTIKQYKSIIDKANFYWNAALTVLSVFMFSGLFGSMMYNLYTIGNFYDTICDANHVLYTPVVVGSDGSVEHNPTHTWIFFMFVFGWSKHIELFDTLFIMLRRPGRRPMLLHWYHHVSVLFFTWYASKSQMLAGLLFATVNSFVHMVMYYYYTLAAIGKKPKWAIWVTTIQLLQMVAGIYISVIIYNAYKAGVPCNSQNQVFIISSGFVMYLSYFILFLRLFCSSYIKIDIFKTPYVGIVVAFLAVTGYWVYTNVYMQL